MLKEVLTVAKVAKKSSLFLGGVAFGTLGLKIWLYNICSG